MVRAQEGQLKARWLLGSRRASPIPDALVTSTRHRHELTMLGSPRRPLLPLALMMAYNVGRKKFVTTCLATLRPIWSPCRIECRQCSPAHTRASSISRTSAFRSS